MNRQLLYNYCPACGLYTHTASGTKTRMLPMHLNDSPDVTTDFCPDCLAEAKDILFEDGCDLDQVLLNLVPYTAKDLPENIRAAKRAQREYNDMIYQALRPPTETELYSTLKDRV